MGLGLLALVAMATVTGCAGLGTGPSTALGGTVEYRSDGAPATTKIDVAADGAGVSGTAVTTFGSGTHTVDVECAARDGDTFAFAGTTAETTVPGESAGDWSAVIVKDGSPQKIGIWLSDTKTDGVDCGGWLDAIDMSTIGVENFDTVESGTLVAPS
jgi:hypothetical protein